VKRSRGAIHGPRDRLAEWFHSYWVKVQGRNYLLVAAVPNREIPPCCSPFTPQPSQRENVW